MFEASILLGVFVLLAILRVPIAFGLIVSCLVLFTLEDRLLPWVVTQRLFSGVDSFVLLAVPFFISAGHIMNEAKVTDRLIALAYSIMGAIRGGLAMVNVGVSMLFAGVSGSSTADTAGVGTVLIPQMQRRGYATDFTVAVTASSSVIGTIIPPSIQLIVWGSLTQTSIAGLFLGGLIPGVLVGVALLALVYVLSRRAGYPKEERSSFKAVLIAFRDSVLALSIPVVVVGGIVFGFMTATEAAVFAVLVALVLGLLVYRTLSVRDLPGIFSRSANLTALPLFALSAASIFGYLLAYYRVPFLLEGGLEGIHPMVLLPVLALLWLIIGTFLDALPAMAIMVPVFQPVVDAAGLDPIHYGVVSVMALALGLVTPPYGLCLLLASAIADVPVIRVLRPLFVFFLAILIVIMLCIAIPALVTFLPGLAA